MYDVIVLANQESLSDETIAIIKNFVNKGGGLVATGRTGKYDAWRRLRQIDLLHEMLAEAKGADAVSGKRREGAFTFRYGKGRVSYIPELIRPEGEIKLGYVTNWMTPKNADELEAAVIWTAGKKLPLLVTAPEWVGVSHDIQEKRDVIHLFNYNHQQNVTGVTMQYRGEIKKAFAVSPDVGEEFAIPFTESGGITELRIPDFPVYTIVVLQRK